MTSGQAVGMDPLDRLAAGLAPAFGHSLVLDIVIGVVYGIAIGLALSALASQSR